MSSKQYSIRLILNNSTEREYIRKERVTKKGILASHKEAISTPKSIPSNNRLQIARQIDFPKVRTFLESVARGSKNSKSSYEVGLKHFQGFLNSNITNSDNNNNSANDCYHDHYNIETILMALQSNKLNVYEILDSFVSYLINMPHQPPMAPTSIAIYVYVVRSYIQYHDIDINPSKFRRRVKLPKPPREDERPIDASEIRNILLACNNRRLKAYILVLASGGMRAIEGLAIRVSKVHYWRCKRWCLQQSRMSKQQNSNYGKF